MKEYYVISVKCYVIAMVTKDCSDVEAAAQSENMGISRNI